MIKFLNTKNESFKSVVKTVLFYAIYIGLALILEKIYPSGPCTPSFGILMLIFLPIANVFLLIIFVVNYFYNNKKHLKLSIFIHILIILIFSMYFLFG